MGVDTGIQWTHHTWSSWRGCAKVSHGCTNCYADALSKRNPAVLGVWGPSGTRVIAKDWTKPLAWDRAAAKAGERRRIFMSMNDWLEDRPELDEPRARLLELIDATQNLDWLLLTKRPENFQSLMERLAAMNGCAGGDVGHDVAASWIDGDPPPNVWLGVSVEDQETADARIPALLKIPAALRWVSYEPALGPVAFVQNFGGGVVRNWLSGAVSTGWRIDYGRRLNWVVCGGESGPNARPFDLQWARNAIRQCSAAGVPVFVKQLGRRPIWSDARMLDLRDKKGGVMDEWPLDMRVREMPEGGGA